MAGAATATYTTETFMSPGMNGGHWDYAVPIGPEVGAVLLFISSWPFEIRETITRTLSGLPASHGHPDGVVLPGWHANNRAVSRSSSRRSKRARARRDTGESRAAYDVDGPLDSYRRDSSASKNAANMLDSVGHQNGSAKRHDYPDGMHGPYTEEEMNDEYWIHRDKLAKIESEELQQAAIRFQRQARAGSKSSSRRGRSHDRYSNGVNGSQAVEHNEPWPNVHDEKPSDFDFWGNDGNEPTEEERQNWDLRRPEEIAADQEAESSEDGASKMYRNPGLRKSSSRIPVLATSPAPISQEHIEREFPLLRRRTHGSADADSISYPKPARSSESPEIDTPEATPTLGTTTPPLTTSRPVSRGVSAQNSPGKKTPGKTTPGSGTRKTSGQSTTKKTPQKSRATSGSSTRPTTRGGDARPTTAANRPEGDPPWLATMYKPDPRLPPDQQMLPTHAKRMQQEQWEKEGKTPSAYDREFGPLAVRTDDEKSKSRVVSPEPAKSNSEPEKSPEPEQESPAWPLKSPKSPEPNPLTRPPTGGTGYSAMPKVQTTPPIGVAPTPRMNPPWPEPEPEKPNKKGCGCCIVM
ncbi:conserved hypothetical protein [Paecilomyces variotii No. 5]|uniref:TeaA receptor TeaR n=1 Tax=Byssochlamys spectabilis (strain No. 5 / NBRC 109023) TaxID=1356009 RepID=V5I1D7_BYSSN|nr:conserved hypothetical protein [Paecilomyces variotii No. 5]